MRTRVREAAREVGFLIAFFRVVPPVPPLMTSAFVVLTVSGGLVMAIDPRQAERAVVPILLLQMFATSCGFAVPARRGYYDVLLTRGAGRLGVALVQWVVASVSGVVCWIALGAVEVLALGEGTVLASGTAVAMCLVSVLPWALTAALPRFSGAIGWLVLGLTTSLPVPPGWPWLGSGVEVGLDSWVLSALAPVVNPISLVGRHVDDGLVRAAGPAIAMAAVAMAVALRWIVRAEFRLEAAQ